MTELSPPAASVFPSGLKAAVEAVYSVANNLGAVVSDVASYTHTPSVEATANCLPFLDSANALISPRPKTVDVDVPCAARCSIGWNPMPNAITNIINNALIDLRDINSPLLTQKYSSSRALQGAT